MGMLFFLNHFWRLVSNTVIWAMVTFGNRPCCVGGRPGCVGYGWCAHASNFSPFTLDSSCAKRPGDSLGWTPVTALSCPRGDVSPNATCAVGLAALIPAYPALYRAPSTAGATALPFALNCGARNCCRLGSFQTV